MPSDPNAPTAFFYPHDHTGTATVALARLKLSLHDSFEPVEFPNKDSRLYRRLQRMKTDWVARVRDAYVETIAEAAERQADFVCFGELTYPHNDDEDAEAEFAAELQRLADEHGMHIIAGSFHRFDGPAGARWNASRTFVPGRARPVEQIKFFTAKATGEYVDVITPPRTEVVGTPDCNYATVICVDVAGTFVAASIGERNVDAMQEFRPIHLVFCPSFSRSSAMFGHAAKFSTISGATTALVNGCLDEGVGETALYQHGNRKINHVDETAMLRLYHIAQFIVPPRQVAEAP